MWGPTGLRGAAEHLTKHRIARTTKNYTVPNVCSVEIEKPCGRVHLHVKEKNTILTEKKM